MSRRQQSVLATGRASGLRVVLPAAALLLLGGAAFQLAPSAAAEASHVVPAPDVDVSENGSRQVAVFAGG